jgi:hypothetical protein
MADAICCTEAALCYAVRLVSAMLYCRCFFAVPTLLSAVLSIVTKLLFAVLKLLSAALLFTVAARMLCFLIHKPQGFLIGVGVLASELIISHALASPPSYLFW